MQNDYEVATENSKSIPFPNFDISAVSQQKKTNYDYLTYLPVHKFAEFIVDVTNSDLCDYCLYNCTPKCDESKCVGGIIEYLLSEHKAEQDL